MKILDTLDWYAAGGNDDGERARDMEAEIEILKKLLENTAKLCDELIGHVPEEVDNLLFDIADGLTELEV